MHTILNFNHLRQPRAIQVLPCFQWAANNSATDATKLTSFFQCSEAKVTLASMETMDEFLLGSAQLKSRARAKSTNSRRKEVTQLLVLKLRVPRGTLTRPQAMVALIDMAMWVTSVALTCGKGSLWTIASQK